MEECAEPVQRAHAYSNAAPRQSRMLQERDERQQLFERILRKVLPQSGG